MTEQKQYTLEELKEYGNKLIKKKKLPNNYIIYSNKKIIKPFN